MHICTHYCKAHGAHRMYHKLQRKARSVSTTLLFASLNTCGCAPQMSMNKLCCRSHKRFARTRGLGCTFALTTTKLMVHIVCTTSCNARHVLLLQLCSLLHLSAVDHDHKSTLPTLLTEDAHLHLLLRNWGCILFVPQAATQGKFCFFNFALCFT